MRAPASATPEGFHFPPAQVVRRSISTVSSRPAKPKLDAPLRHDHCLIFQTNLVEKRPAPSTDGDPVVVKDLEQALPHLPRFLAGINRLPDATLLVVRDNGGSLLMVGTEALLERFGVVIGALDERLTRHVIGHIGLGWVEDLMVGPARGGVDEAASDTRDEEGIINLELNCVLERLVGARKHVVKFFGLRHRSGEAVKDEAAQGISAKCFLEVGGYMRPGWPHVPVLAF